MTITAAINQPHKSIDLELGLNNLDTSETNSSVTAWLSAAAHLFSPRLRALPELGPMIFEVPTMSRLIGLAHHRFSELVLKAITENLDLMKSNGIEIKVENRWKIAPKSIVLENNQGFIRASMRGVESTFVPDGCDARAAVIADHAKWHFGPGHIFRMTLTPSNKMNNGDEEACIECTRGDYQGVNWIYHEVAAFVSDQNIIYIMDPVCHSSTALPLNQWLHAFQINATKLHVKLAPGDNGTRALLNTKARYALSKHRRTLDIMRARAVTNRSNFLDTSALLRPNHLKWHHPEAGFAYPVNPFSSSDMKFVSFKRSTLFVSEEHHNTGFDDRKLQVNAIDWSWTGEAHIKDRTTHPIFVLQEQPYQGLSTQDIERLMQDNNIVRLEILTVPCIFSNSSTYRIIE